MTTQTSTIYIIGAGAVGKALAVFLKQRDKQVIILRGSIDNTTEHDETTTVEMPDGCSISATIKVSALSNYTTLDGIVVLTNKSYGNGKLAQKLKDKIGSSPLVLLQNGLNVEEPFLAAQFKQLYRCVLFTSCQQPAPGKIKFKPANISQVGLVTGNPANLATIVEQLDNPYLQFSANENIQPVVWTKAIVNSVFNTVCPLLETDNGIFTRSPMALQLAERIITECVLIANKKGILLQVPAIIDTLLMISRTSSGQLISTYQDILNKRETEIETLNFAFADMARQLQIPEAVTETRLLGDLIKLKSAISRQCTY